MSAPGDLSRAIARVVGQSVRGPLERVAGGDINDALVGTLDDGTEIFVKTRRQAPDGLYRAEAAGLAWLRDADALPVPEVVGVLDPGDPGDATAPRALVLRRVVSGPRHRRYDEDLGRGLAAVHRAGAPRFGHPAPSFIGPIPMENDPSDSWARFYGERRLQPMARRAVDAGGAPGSLLRAVEELVPRLAELVGPEEPPARLHGDLWGGNHLAGPRGEPMLIDPAVYGGHREVDLAMMRLFGGFSPRVFQAYEEAHPLAPEAEDRVLLHQLWPLLVHAALFGGGYGSGAEAAARRYL